MTEQSNPVELTLAQFDFQPETLKYLASFKEDPDAYLTELNRVNSLIVNQTIKCGETKGVSVSNEMEALFTLQIYMGFLQSMKPKKGSKDL